MKDIFLMWRKPKMVFLFFLTAFVYAALLIPFKSLTIVPGFTEVRLGNMIPISFGIFFGPAAAWGSALGNFIADLLGGTFSSASYFALIGNFLFAYLPYKLWNNLGVLQTDEEMTPDCRSRKKILWYIAFAFVASTICGLWIGWGCEIVKLLPFFVLGSIISLNNAFVSIIFGIPLTFLLFPVIKKHGLYYKEIMQIDLKGKKSFRSESGARVILTIPLICWGAALLLSYQYCR